MANLTAKFKLIDEMSEKLDSIADSGKDMIDTWEKSSSSISSAMDKFEQSASSAAESTDHWTSAVGNYDKGALEAIYSTEELVEMGFKSADALKEIEDSSDKAGRGLEELSDESEEAGEHLEDTGEKGANAMNELERAITSAGLIILMKKLADAFMEASKAAAEYEVAINKISTVADTSAVSIDTISSELLELSQETGISVGELSEATYSALSASVDTAKAVQFTATATKLAAGGFTSSATAVDVLTTALNAYGLSADNAESISDMLITTQNLGKTTVDQLASSVGKVIPLASAYGVEMDNLSAAYAELTKGGIATAESGTYLKAMLNELGDSGSTVSTVLKEQTGESFSQLMERGYSLGDVMEVLGNSVNGNAGAFNELWSSSEAGIGALSLYNAGAEQFNKTLDAMQNSVGATSTAYKTMTDTTAHAEEELTNATDNLQIAIGRSLNPSIEKLYKTGATIVNGLAKFAKEHPTVVKAITAISIGVGAFVAGIVAYTAATKAAAIAQAALNAVMDANPIFLIATAVTAATVALVGFTAAIAFAAEEEEELSYKSQVQKDHLEELQAEYDATAEKYGESSYQAQELQWQIEELSDEYNSQKQTLEEWKTKFDEAMLSYHDFAEERQQHIDEAELEGDKVLNLAMRLETLANKTDRSAAEQQEMLAIMEKLNGEIPGLSLQYDELSGSIEGSTDAIIALAEAEVARRKYEAYGDELIASIEKRTELQNTLTEATDQYNATLQKQADAQAAYDEAVAARAAADAAYTGPKDGGEAAGRAYASYIIGYVNDVNSASDALDRVNDEVEEAAGRVDEATAAVEDNENAIASISGKMADLSSSSQDAFANAQSVNEVIDAMATSVTELAAAYDEAYQAAKTSFDGQFGLFDEAKANMDSTVANAQAAMDSQLTYWDTYLNNVNVLKDTSAADLGITQENYNALMQFVQDGSAEAAGLAQSMVDAINSGNSEAITNLANTVGEVQAKRDEAAGAVAEWQIDFNGKMDEIVQKAEQAVDDMNLSSEAESAASSTINAYADAILSQGGKAIANAKSIATQVQAALNSVSVNVPTTTGKGYAEGTDYATPGTHLVGERGPELVEFRGGEKVYNNEETERIMARSAAVKLFSSPEGGTALQENAKSDPKDNTKTIRLEINGGGAIEVNGSLDETAVVEILQANLKPVLTSIVKQEIYEEGERSYDY